MTNLNLLESKMIDSQTLEQKYRYDFYDIGDTVQWSETFYVAIDGSMIWISKVAWDELDELIENDSDEYRAFDMTDGVAYFMTAEMNGYERIAIANALVAYVGKIK